MLLFERKIEDIVMSMLHHEGEMTQKKVTIFSCNQITNTKESYTVFTLFLILDFAIDEQQKLFTLSSHIFDVIAGIVELKQGIDSFGKEMGILLPNMNEDDDDSQTNNDASLAIKEEDIIPDFNSPDFG